MAMAAANVDPAVAPKIVKFAFKDFYATTTKRSAICKTCGVKITDGPQTTSNFVRHVKTHRDRHAQYLQFKEKDENQSSISSFVSNGGGKYASGHSRQRAVTASIVSDIIIGCSMPLSLVENISFRRFMEVVDLKYSHVSRSTVIATINSMVIEMQEKIQNCLAGISNLAVTVDIWSDRQMRGFLGVTAHALQISATAVTPKTYLLGCRRFLGKHTGERICEQFESLCDDYHIKNKIDYILSDNASNMRRAFTVCFPASVDSDETLFESTDYDDYLHVDNDDLWQDLQENEQLQVDAMLLRSARKKQLQCFAHTIQLVVSDGLKETKCIRPALAKASRLCTLLHSSCLFKEAFETKFGTDKGIPTDACTRWHSTLRQIKSIVKLDHLPLNDLVDNQGHKEIVFSNREWHQLEELTIIMEPFYEATVLCQDEFTVTISAVLPSVLSINHHLNRMAQKKDLHLTNLVRVLKESLMKRFIGIFVNMHMATEAENPDNLPFGDVIYMIVAFLDPRFALQWLDNDVIVDGLQKSNIRKRMTDIIITAVQTCPEVRTVSAAEQFDENNGPATDKQQLASSLFAGYKRRRTETTETSVDTQLSNYLALCDDESDSSNAFSFWSMHRSRMEKIFPLAMRVLSVPASSAPIERVFSHGGVIMRPHRSRLNDKTLSSLVFLKCNSMHN